MRRMLPRWYDSAMVSRSSLTLDLSLTATLMRAQNTLCGVCGVNRNHKTVVNKGHAGVVQWQNVSFPS
jgi:hypothetical protein